MALFTEFTVSFGELHLLLKILEEICTCSSVSWYCHYSQEGQRLPTDSARSQDKDSWSCFTWACQSQLGSALSLHLIYKKITSLTTKLLPECFCLYCVVECHPILCFLFCFFFYHYLVVTYISFLWSQPCMYLY